MDLRLITPPATEPVSVETAKAFLRVDGTEDDALITSLIKAAREKGEELARRAFLTQTWDLILDQWPSTCRQKIYRPPLQSVTSVKYLDSSNVEHTWTDYATDARNEPGMILFNSLPSDTLLASGAIAIRFQAGYGAETAVPERIKSMILALVTYWYENRDSQAVPAYIQQAFVAERAVWF